jgi:hypothetical protein
MLHHGKRYPHPTMGADHATPIPTARSRDWEEEVGDQLTCAAEIMGPRAVSCAPEVSLKATLSSFFLQVGLLQPLIGLERVQRVQQMADAAPEQWPVTIESHIA